MLKIKQAIIDASRYNPSSICYHYLDETRLISIESQPKKIAVVVVVVIGVVAVVVHVVVVDPRNIPLEFG